MLVYKKIKHWKTDKGNLLFYVQGKLSYPSWDSTWSDDFIGHPVPGVDQHFYKYHKQLSKRWGTNFHLCLGYHLHSLCFWSFAWLCWIADQKEDAY